MASKTSMPATAGVFMTLIGVFALAGFIGSVIFYGQSKRAAEELEQMRTDRNDVITAAQRNNDQIGVLIEQARSQRESLVGYLDSSLRETMRRVTGNESDTVQQLTLALDGDPGDPNVPGIEGADAASLLQLINQRDSTIRQMSRDLDAAQSNLAAAQSDLQEEVERVRQLQAQYDQTVGALNAQLAEYESDLTQYRDSVTNTIDTNNDRVQEIRRTAAEQTESLQAMIAELEQENLVLAVAVENLRAETAETTIGAQGEYALVDGRILGTNPSQNEVFISLGRSDRVVVGMTFEVYDDGARIRPNSEGTYPPGKAAIEVIRINQGSSTARVIRENPRNPIVEADVIANALYDPNKVYSFVVFGNFDANGDGQATSQERGGIVGLISDWGGIVQDELSGDTDFLVLGERPVLPPEPSPDSPLPVIQDYIRKKQTVEEYDRLFRIAGQTSIPVLNQNRLYTLTGLNGAR